VAIDIYRETGPVAEKEGAPSRGLHQISNMIPPGNLAGANHPGGKKEDALHAMGTQDGIATA